METTDLKKLVINRMTKEQFDTEKEAGRLLPNELYMTPSEDYYTKEETEEAITNKGYQTAQDVADAIDQHNEDETAHLDIRTAIGQRYTKPAAGIPKNDLASGVQSSLSKADSALQEHQSLAAYRTSSAQDVIDATKYSATNPPPYPVTSVNGQTGAVTVSRPQKVVLDD